MKTCTDGIQAGREREVHDGGDICRHIADSFFRIAETNTTSQNNYTPKI